VVSFFVESTGEDNFELGSSNSDVQEPQLEGIMKEVRV